MSNLTPQEDSSLMEYLKPQLDAMNEMYKAAFEEGRRSAFREMLPGITKLQEQAAKIGESDCQCGHWPCTTVERIRDLDPTNFLTKNEGAETLLKQQGENHEEEIRERAS